EEDWSGAPSAQALTTDFWRALSAGDLPGAFWLALEWEGGRTASGSQEQGKEAGVFPSWAVLAAYLGLQAHLDSEQALEMMQKIILEHPRPVQELAAVSGLPEDVCAQFVLLASVRPTLLAPQTSAWNWFQAASQVLRPDADEAFLPLVEAVHDLAR